MKWHRNVPSTRQWLAAAIVALASGCASRPTPELAAARTAYATARSSRSSELARSDLYDAYAALRLAEAAFDEDEPEARERHLAYVARRKAEAALMKGELGRVERQLAEAQRRLDTAARRATLRELREARTRLERESKRFLLMEERLREERKTWRDPPLAIQPR